MSEAAQPVSQPASQLDHRCDGPDRIVCWSPASGERLGSLKVTTPAEVGAAMRRARAAQPAWAARTVKQRAEVFKGIQDGFVKAMPRLVRLLMAETGKPAATAIWAELVQTAYWLGWYRRKASGALKTVKRRPELQFNRAVHIEYHPRGVVAVISPCCNPYGVKVNKMKALSRRLARRINKRKLALDA